jgi:hypothetical protein
MVFTGAINPIYYLLHPGYPARKDSALKTSATAASSFARGRRTTHVKTLTNSHPA